MQATLNSIETSNAIHPLFQVLPHSGHDPCRHLLLLLWHVLRVRRKLCGDLQRRALPAADRGAASDRGYVPHIQPGIFRGLLWHVSMAVVLLVSLLDVGLLFLISIPLLVLLCGSSDRRPVPRVV